MTRGLLCSCAALLVLGAGVTPAHADQPLTQLTTWSGSVDFFATGAPMAVDGPDPDTTLVDMIAQPASVTVNASDLPLEHKLQSAFLYWGGSIVNDDCLGTTIDDTVTFTPPGGAATMVTADVCYCSDAGALSYDQQICRKDVRSLIKGTVGTYTVDQFNALIMNGSTNNASFSLVLVYSSPVLPPRRVALWDGLRTMSNNTQTITLSGIDVDNPAEGSLTWYVMEGDIGGSTGEQVTVTGQPGGLGLTLTDALNPANNPMNRTINTTTPTQPNSIGVDIDRFSINGALTTNDSSVVMDYAAGNDKWWIAYNIVSVNVYEPAFGAGSGKSWALHVDADNDTFPSPGDTIRYTIRLENTGTAPGVVSITDPIPAEAASWTLVDAANGTDASTMNQLVVNNIAVPAGSSDDVVIDVVIAEVPDETEMNNTCAFDASPDGDAGSLVAPPVVIQNDPPGTGGMGGGGMGGAAASTSAGIGGAATAAGTGGSTRGPTSSGSGGREATVADGSCGCEVVGSDRRRSGLGLGLLGLLAFAGRRRRGGRRRV